MSTIQTYLSSLGLNAEQSELFLTLATTGPMTILQLSQTTSVPRTTVYLYGEEMLHKGLIKEQEEGKKKRYVAVSPRELLILIQNKKKDYHVLSEEFSLNLPEFEGLYYQAGRPRMMYYDDKNGLERLFYESLTTGDKWYMLWTSSKRKEIQAQIDGLYGMLDDHLIHTKELYLADHAGKLSQIHRTSLRHEIALFPSIYETSADTIIMERKVVYISYEPSVYALVIEDLHIAHTEKMKFLALFDTALTKEKLDREA
jgi:predicted transcriptional regulator